MVLLKFGFGMDEEKLMYTVHGKIYPWLPGFLWCGYHNNSSNVNFVVDIVY